MAFTPEAFGKYFLVDRIAAGGMAEIFAAKSYSHGGFEHLLVIKRILAHLGDNEEFVEMFIDEAKVSVALQHANIIRIYDFGKILDNYFIAMEWVDGKDARNILKKLSKQRKFLPVEYACYIAHEACKGLDYAHKKSDLQGSQYGIVHRDVSPSNILVSYEGDVKVADFGIAKAESNAYNTKDGVLKGKFEYMSPEQAEGAEIDARSDIFSVGIILHEMLTGRRLFKTGSDTGTLEKIKAGGYPTPSSLHNRVPPELDRIVMKALSRREERYQAASEMVEDLAKFLAPASVDQMRAKVAHFMREAFDEEIADERRRIDENSQIAEQIRKTMPAPESWDGSTNSTMSQTSYRPAPQRSLLPFVAMGAVVLLVAVVAIVVGGAALMGSQTVEADPPPPPVVIEQAPAAPTTGALDVLLLPGGQIFVNDEPRGEGTVTLSSLEPGEYAVRVELDGYETVEEKVKVTAGETTKFMKTLTKVKRASTGTTTKVVKPPPVQTESGGSAASGPGKLTVTVVGGGWANVFVNGEKQGKTAPGTLELPAGSYEIRVSNPAIGLDHTEKVTVPAGGTAKIAAKPQ